MKAKMPTKAISNDGQTIPSDIFVDYNSVNETLLPILNMPLSENDLQEILMCNQFTENLRPHFFLLNYKPNPFCDQQFCSPPPCHSVPTLLHSAGTYLPFTNNYLTALFQELFIQTTTPSEVLTSPLPLPSLPSLISPPLVTPSTHRSSPRRIYLISHHTDIIETLFSLFLQSSARSLHSAGSNTLCSCHALLVCPHPTFSQGNSTLPSSPHPVEKKGEAIELHICVLKHHSSLLSYLVKCLESYGELHYDEEEKVYSISPSSGSYYLSLSSSLFPLSYLSSLSSPISPCLVHTKVRVLEDEEFLERVKEKKERRDIVREVSHPEYALGNSFLNTINGEDSLLRELTLRSPCLPGLTPFLQEGRNQTEQQNEQLIKRNESEEKDPEANCQNVNRQSQVKNPISEGSDMGEAHTLEEMCAEESKRDGSILYSRMCSVSSSGTRDESYPTKGISEESQLTRLISERSRSGRDDSGAKIVGVVNASKGLMIEEIVPMDSITYGEKDKEGKKDRREKNELSVSITPTTSPSPPMISNRSGKECLMEDLSVKEEKGENRKENEEKRGKKEVNNKGDSGEKTEKGERGKKTSKEEKVVIYSATSLFHRSTSFVNNILHPLYQHLEKQYPLQSLVLTNNCCWFDIGDGQSDEMTLSIPLPPPPVEPVPPPPPLTLITPVSPLTPITPLSPSSLHEAWQDTANTLINLVISQGPQAFSNYLSTQGLSLPPYKPLSFQEFIHLPSGSFAAIPLSPSYPFALLLLPLLRLLLQITQEKLHLSVRLATPQQCGTSSIRCEKSPVRHFYCLLITVLDPSGHSTPSGAILAKAVARLPLIQAEGEGQGRLLLALRHCVRNVSIQETGVLIGSSALQKSCVVLNGGKRRISFQILTQSGTNATSTGRPMWLSSLGESVTFNFIQINVRGLLCEAGGEKIELGEKIREESLMIVRQSTSAICVGVLERIFSILGCSGRYKSVNPLLAQRRRILAERKGRDEVEERASISPPSSLSCHATHPSLSSHVSMPSHPSLSSVPSLRSHPSLPLLAPHSINSSSQYATRVPIETNAHRISPREVILSDVRVAKDMLAVSERYPSNFPGIFHSREGFDLEREGRELRETGDVREGRDRGERRERRDRKEEIPDSSNEPFFESPVRYKEEVPERDLHSNPLLSTRSGSNKHKFSPFSLTSSPTRQRPIHHSSSHSSQQPSNIFLSSPPCEKAHFNATPPSYYSYPAPSYHQNQQEVIKNSSHLPHFAYLSYPSHLSQSTFPSASFVSHNNQENTQLPPTLFPSNNPTTPPPPNSVHQTLHTHPSHIYSNGNDARSNRSYLLLPSYSDINENSSCSYPSSPSNLPLAYSSSLCPTCPRTLPPHSHHSLPSYGALHSLRSP